MRKRMLSRPSPALVISLLALFVALGGTSYAATRLPKNSVGTKQLKKHAVTRSKIADGAVSADKIDPTGLTVPIATHATVADNVLWAVVAGDGTLARGSGAASAQRFNVGQYQVVFDRDVTNCAYSATIGPTSIGTAQGVTDVASSATNTAGVFLQTFAPGGVTLADLPFHLIVTC